MNLGSAKILAGEEGLVLLSIGGDLADRLERGVIFSSVIDNASRSLRSSASILYYNISNPYMRVERRS